MKLTAANTRGWGHAALTAAALEALSGASRARGEEPRILWDWDERISHGTQRRAAMHICGLGLEPADFDPRRHLEADYDDDGNVEGVYHADDWELSPAAYLLGALGVFEEGSRFLIVCWTRGNGRVTALQAGADYLSANSAWDGGYWQAAAAEAMPHWIAERPDGTGVSIVPLDARVPPDPGEHDDNAGLDGLQRALDRYLFSPQYPVELRDYAPEAEMPEGLVLTKAFGQVHALDRCAEMKGVVKEGEAGMGASVWWVLRPDVSPNLAGRILAISEEELVVEAIPAGDEAWDAMRDYGIEAGFDRVVIADRHLGRPPAKRAEIFRENFPYELEERNRELTTGIRTRGPHALDTRMEELHEVWAALNRFETPVITDESSTAAILGAYTSPKLSPPARQSKSSPRIVWISAGNRSRPVGYLEDLAARYHPERNLLEINHDFPAFRALTYYWTDTYARARGIETPEYNPAEGIHEITREHNELYWAVDEVVCEWCEQTLVEVVIGINALSGRRGWDEARIREALSPEALSAAAMAIYHVQQSIKRSLGQRLGSLKKEQIV